MYYPKVVVGGDAKLLKMNTSVKQTTTSTKYYVGAVQWERHTGLQNQDASLVGSNPTTYAKYGPLAQPDRALGYEPRGREFESSTVHQIKKHTTWLVTNKTHKG